MNLHRPVAEIAAAVAAACVATLLGAILATAFDPVAAATPATTAQPIRLATLEWEPYIGTQMPNQGYVAELIRAAFADQGMTVEIEFYPWARALHLARTGEADGLMPEYFDARRESDFEYSAGFPGGPLVLYRRQSDEIEFSADPGSEQDTALRALKARRFGVVRGYLNTPVFDAADYLTKFEANDDEANLRKLVFGRTDLAVIDRRVAEHLIRTRHPEYSGKIVPMHPPLAEIPLFIAFSRNSPRLRESIAAFNAGLRAMEADGRITELYRRYILEPLPAP